MIKKTLYFGNPCFLSVKDKQLNIEMRETGETRTIPVEDIGVIMLDHYGVTLTQWALNALVENNTAVIVCNATHHPSGLFFPLEGNTLQQEFFSQQINASVPLKKQLWQQTVRAKILNQAAHLKRLGKNHTPMELWAKEVQSGDTTNKEARAAKHYWDELFTKDFTRERFGAPPNNMLNYGYAILRAIVARSFTGSGLLPTLGIHHHNRYNAYCLADDVMEPFRPLVDAIVYNIVESEEDITGLTPALKKKFLEIPVLDVRFGDEQSPLMVGMSKTTASLARCFTGEEKTIVYPVL